MLIIHSLKNKARAINLINTLFFRINANFDLRWLLLTHFKHIISYNDDKNDNYLPDNDS